MTCGFILLLGVPGCAKQSPADASSLRSEPNPKPNVEPASATEDSAKEELPDVDSSEMETPEVETSAEELSQPELAPNPKAAPPDLASLRSRLPAPEDALPQEVVELFNEGVLEGQWVVAKFPQNPDAYEILARMYLMSGEYTKATETWNKALLLNSNLPYAQYGLGQVASRRGDYAEAALRYERAIELLPTYSDALLAAAEAFARLGSNEKAAQRLQQILAREPGHSLAWTRLGLNYSASGEHQKAAHAFAAALERGPNSRNALQGYAIALARSGELKEAKEVQKQLKALCARRRSEERQSRKVADGLKIHSQQMAKKYSSLGTLYMTLRDFENAERILQRAARLDPESIQPLDELTRLYIGLGQAEPAGQMLQKMIALEPNNVEHLANFGMVLMQLQQPEKMIEVYKKCVELERSADTLGLLAQAYFVAGQREKAIQTVDAALELKGDSVELAQMRRQWLSAP